MNEMKPFDPHLFKDLDEMSMTPKQFEQYYGYAPEGDRAVRL